MVKPLPQPHCLLYGQHTVAVVKPSPHPRCLQWDHHTSSRGRAFTTPTLSPVRPTWWLPLNVRDLRMSLFRSGGEMASWGVAGGDVGPWLKPCWVSAIFNLAGSSCFIPSNEDHCRMNCTSFEYSPHFVRIWNTRHLLNLLTVLYEMLRSVRNINIHNPRLHYASNGLLLHQKQIHLWQLPSLTANSPQAFSVHHQDLMSLDICELQCLGFWPFIITHLNIT